MTNFKMKRHQFSYDSYFTGLKDYYRWIDHLAHKIKGGLLSDDERTNLKIRVAIQWACRKFLGNAEYKVVKPKLFTGMDSDLTLKRSLEIIQAVMKYLKYEISEYSEIVGK